MTEENITINKEELTQMPSNTVTDVDLIPDQTPLADIEGETGTGKDE